MAQEPGSQNKTVDFVRENRAFIIVAAIIVAAIVYFAVRGDNDFNNNQTAQQGNEQQQSGQNQNQGNQNQSGNNQGTPGTTQGETTGNVTATGTLQRSDNSSRGNYMVDSNRGKIYVSTSRDYSSLEGKRVTLQAQGTINKFVFLGFNDSSTVADDDGLDRGGAAEAGNVSFSGTLKGSDNTSRGNYMIVSGATKVYLKSVRDYSGWIDSQVRLSATGTINSFTNAYLTK